MLVMRRKAGEAFQIGSDIEIEILEVGPTRVKLGIKAPAALPIVRQEVQLTRRQNLDAAQPVTPQTIEWLTRTLVPSR